MTCTDARLLVAFRRPGGGDLLPEDTLELDRHLAGCPACTASAAGESAFDAAMARAVNAVPVPAGLKAGLYAAAGKTLIAGRVRRVGRIAALAAALLAAVGLALSIYAVNRPTLDLERLAYLHDVNGREKATLDWLNANRLPTALPYDFDFSLCTHHGLGDLQGQSVPVLLFQDPKTPLGFAQVFLVPDGTFKKGAAEPAGSSFVTALKIDGGPQARGFTFVVFHTGDLARFLRAIPNPG